jgi:hypothetical protein
VSYIPIFSEATLRADSVGSPILVKACSSYENVIRDVLFTVPTIAISLITGELLKIASESP